jgi:glucokinase
VTGAGAIGVDLGGTNLKLALLDGDNQIVARVTTPTDGAAGHDAVIARMVDGVRELRAARPEVAVATIGVGVPGLVDSTTGITGDLPNLPGRWIDVPVGPALAAATGLAVGVINDAKAFALAELRLGAAAGARTALFVTVGTGIGGAVVAHGELVFGVDGATGEIGHLIMQPEGPRCTCGNLGCLEMLASGPAIVGEAARRVAQGFDTSLSTLIGNDRDAITPQLVADAADAGDALAADVIERAGRWLGLGLAGAIALLAPEVVVIGGGVAPAGGRYYVAAERTARTHTGVIDASHVAIRPAALGYDAGVIGAALWGREAAARVVRPG